MTEHNDGAQSTEDSGSGAVYTTEICRSMLAFFSFFLFFLFFFFVLGALF